MQHLIMNKIPDSNIASVESHDLLYHSLYSSFQKCGKILTLIES